jgi:hypothetical protein
MERKRAGGILGHLDLPASDCAIAQHTNTLIVERMPFPAKIGRLEQREFVFWRDWYVHFGRRGD